MSNRSYRRDSDYVANVSMNCKIGAGSVVRLGGVLLILLSLTVAGVSEAAPAKSVSDTAQFIKLMERGVNSAYVATYVVSNYDFFSRGSIRH